MSKKFKFLAFLALISISGAIFVAGLFQPTQSATVTKIDCSFSEQELLNKFNAVRVKPLTLDNGLDWIAQQRADVITYELDHHAGFRVLVNNRAFDNKFFNLAEILASNKCASTDQMFNQWKSSEGHWRAILDERYDVLGVGFNGQSAVVIFGDL